MKLFHVRRRTGWANEAQLRDASQRAARVGREQMAGRVRWIQSFVVREWDGRLGMTCIYEAVDAEALREHARLAGIPADEILPIGGAVRVEAEPARSAA
jgi:hypothetical protein